MSVTHANRPPKNHAAAEDESEDDEVLVRCAAEGDESAYATLVHRHLPRILAVARRMLGEDALAEDVAQDVLVKLWRNAGAYDPTRARLSTWLYRVTANLCIDRLRSNRTEPLEDGYDAPVAAVQDRELMERDMAENVDRALQNLPERQRLALIMCHYEGLSMKEAGLIMEVSEDAIESLLARGRRALKKRLQDQWRSLLPDEED